MPNRQFYTYKFNSSFLKEFDYKLGGEIGTPEELTIKKAKENKQVIALSDNQFLRSIRKITNKEINLEKLEELFLERNQLRNKKTTDEIKISIEEIQREIDEMMFIKEYITIVMDHPTHYDYLLKNGLLINDKTYNRLSCSAGQARASTVVFCEGETKKELQKIIDNGRNPNKTHSGSKLNAYIGLNSSATSIVSTPKFCVVADYKSKSGKAKFNLATETEWDQDDIIEIEELEQEINRFDGQGLISFEKSKEWSVELGLDYVPAQWCIRQNYLKGMLCTFDFREFCKLKNDENYLIKTSYKDENGNNKYTDLRDCDVIISESQFKLWDSFESQEIYEKNCKENSLFWGVSLYTPKEDKNILKMNYQFLQTLNLSKEDITAVSKQFVDWIEGVNGNDFYYTLLFLMGKEISDEGLNNYLEKSKNYWIKSLIVNPQLYKDKYFKEKIYNLMKNRIKKACMGDIILDGNFQVIVSDPYAMMQHVCGLTVTGLLKKGEYFSNYWNNKNINIIDSMRAPLTFRSEHVKLNLVQNKNTKNWYKYCTTGIIVNVFGNETVRWAGSDFDFDILATTSNSYVIDGIYNTELPVIYNPPTPSKVIITEDVLSFADKFAFGSIIGSITNKNTTAQALLPMFPIDSREYKMLLHRIKMCTKLQSQQIDKAKIGKEVKGIPKHWIERKKLPVAKEGEETPKEVIDEINFSNSLLLNRHPYFFKHLYRDTNSKYNRHIEHYNIKCQSKFKVNVLDLIKKENKSEEEEKVINDFNEFMPVINSDCVMNNLCRYIESIDFKIKQRVKYHDTENMFELFTNKKIRKNEDMFNQVLDAYNQNKKKISDAARLTGHGNSSKFMFDDTVGKDLDHAEYTIKSVMSNVCSNKKELVNYLVEIFYVLYPSSNKNLLWDAYGKTMYENVKRNSKCNDKVMFPFPDKNGTIDYLGTKFSIREVKDDKLQI